MNDPKHHVLTSRVIATLGVLTILIFGPVVGHMIVGITSSDYQAHIAFARDIIQDGKFASAHVLYQVLVLTLTKLFSFSYPVAGWFTAVSFYFLTVLIIYRLVRTVLPQEPAFNNRVKAGLTAFMLLIVMPVNLPTLPWQNLYHGYIAINALHNPTIVMLKPLALLLFIFTVDILEQRCPLSARSIGYGCLLVLLSLQAKPNFVLILLPALLLVIVWHLYCRDTRALLTLGMALVLPMLCLLAVEFLLQFALIDGGGAGGIAFAPRLATSLLGHPLLGVAGRFCLSILFPLAVYLSYRPDSQRDTALNLSWLIFVIGVAQMYLFVETGTRQTHGNFRWSAQIGLFVNFVFTTRFWLPYLQHPLGRRERLCIALLGLHVLSGIVYYAVQFQSQTMGDWW